MANAHLVKVDGRTYSILKEHKIRTGVPYGRQIKNAVARSPWGIERLGGKSLGMPAKVKTKVCEY